MAAVPQQPAPGTRDTDRVLTIPNMISFARLLGVPVFLYLYLVAHQKGIAVAVLAVGGTSDWIDGYLARRLHQVSRLGELMDPLADRLYILATVVALTVGGVLPWQFTVVLLARDVVMAACLLVLRRHGFAPPPVHYIGKTATFILLFAFPTLLLAHVLEGNTFWYACGWGLAWWGIVLYWLAAGFYLVQAAGAIRTDRAAGTATT
ncbi:MAG TPA: CDP-alcohol phosphatidyltransferase family protein [Micromonosporaceae bacterium]|nr:CDP-alcohol phosphatidyltransferase family protein [Micromonosporaceae bacterium]